jgi:uncharacterized protein (DUF427 family)
MLRTRVAAQVGSAAVRRVRRKVNGPSFDLHAQRPDLAARPEEEIVGLSWQQGPLGGRSVGRFLVEQPLPERMLFAEPLRRRMRVKFGGEWIVDSEDVVLLHEPGHYPVAYFPRADIKPGVLVETERTTQHKDLGPTEWFTVSAGGREAERAAWQHIAVPEYAGELADRVAFAWRFMDAFYEEDERVVGHAADPYHRNDIRASSRHLQVRDGDRIVADTHRPVALYESGFAPRWYVPREDVDLSALTPAEGQTFCPYKGLASYYDVGDIKAAAWSYLEAWPEVARVRGLISFQPEKIEVYLDGQRLELAPGQQVLEHGLDRGLDPDEILSRG